MKKKSISVFINSLAGGGAERVTSHLLQYLTKKNINPILVLTEVDISYAVPKNVKIYHLDNASNSESGIIKLLKLPFLAYKYARNNGMRVVGYIGAMAWLLITVNIAISKTPLF